MPTWRQVRIASTPSAAAVASAPADRPTGVCQSGSGITLACGTGAAAVCVAGVLTGRSVRKILAHLPGGDLELEWNESDNHVYMTGPAVEICTGDWPDK